VRDGRRLERGELVAYLYRLGRQGASGLLTIGGGGARHDLFALRRGAAVCPEGELARRALAARLVRLVACEPLTVTFEGGVTAYPPGAPNHVALATWARAHLEQQLDGSLADMLARELAGVRLSLRPELAPEPADEADRRMVTALLGAPRRLDQIAPLARTPRFRLLAFVHFLRAVGALALEGVAAVHRAGASARTAAPARTAACRLLGIDDDADVETVKRAYRRLARALHPDLQPHADGARRRQLEQRFAEVTAAYEALV
jgi:DnaJ-domain-containing protein 1